MSEIGFIFFLLNILRTNLQNKTKFCIHIIIDKIYGGIVNSCFSQFRDRVAALDSCQNLVFAQYRGNELTKCDQIVYTHYHDKI